MRSRPLALCFLLTCAVHAASLRPGTLRSEARENPLAIEAAEPRLGWIVEAADPSLTGLRQSAYRILVASTPARLAGNRGDLWDTGKVESGQTMQIPYRGKPVAAQSFAYWKVQVWDQENQPSPWSAVAWWRRAPGPGDWKARWIAAPQSAPADAPLPVFRRSFHLPRAAAQAILSISGLGQYEVTINGRKVSDDLLTPGWTNYRKTVFYNTYDVTGFLRAGGNTIEAMLGNGMYNVARTPGRYTKFIGSFGEPKLIAQVHVQFHGGNSTDILTGASWQYRPGPVVFSSTYGGEDYDARRETGADWQPARETEGPGGEVSPQGGVPGSRGGVLLAQGGVPGAQGAAPGAQSGVPGARGAAPAAQSGVPGAQSSVLVPQTNEPVRAFETFRPVRISEIGPGKRVYDLGRNFAGWPQIRVRGPAGATVKLICGELADDAGRVTQRSSGGPMWFSYTLGGAPPGGAAESWHPRFTYYGFRYVQVESPPGVEVQAVEGRSLRTSAARTGEFTSSSDLLNRIHGLIVAAIESNFESVLTDCPHREKLGWLEESHLLGAAVMYNFDAELQYRKIADDIAGSQTADGLVPDIAPEYTVFDGGFRDSPEWGSAAILDPWLAYQFYGDRDNLARHYGEMQRYAAYLSSKAVDGILSHGLGDWYDIGPRAPGVSQLTSLGVTATAILYDDLATMRKIAEVLGKSEDAARFGADADALRARFNARLFDAGRGVYDRGSQTANAMPLALSMVPQDARQRIVENLVADIRQHGNHTTAGDIGFHFVLQALSEAGRGDVIYAMIANPEAPSYAAQLAAGATTLTEAWDANPRSSQNHFMLGHAEEWFYRSLAGIDFDLSRPPGQQIVLRPTPVGDITSARATYRSVLGAIVSSWKIAGGKFLYDVEIPANASATVYLGGESRQTPSGRHHFEIPYQ